MIILNNNKVFTKNEIEDTEVFFDEFLELHGSYKETKNNYLLFDLQGNKTMAIRKSDNFLINLSDYKGKNWYSYLPIDKQEIYEGNICIK